MELFTIGKRGSCRLPSPRSRLRAIPGPLRVSFEIGLACTARQAVAILVNHDARERLSVAPSDQIRLFTRSRDVGNFPRTPVSCVASTSNKTTETRNETIPDRKRLSHPPPRVVTSQIRGLLRARAHRKRRRTRWSEAESPRSDNSIGIMGEKRDDETVAV